MLYRLFVVAVVVFGLVGSASAQTPTSADADFDGDGVVGIPDFLLFVGVFGASRGDEKYQAKYDLDGDGAIGIPDFLIFVDNFGERVQNTGSGATVTIVDANLRAVIAGHLGKASDATITRGDMASLTFIEARNSDIRDLTGLEFATNLDSLDLGGEWLSETEWVNSNKILEFPNLPSLTKLEWLDISGTGVSNISALSSLTNLTVLYLSYTSVSGFSVGVSDISALSSLTKLTYLDLSYNSISDISALSGLTNLDSLNLSYTNIWNISVLEDLTNLEWLDLSHTGVGDIEPLVGNMGLGSGDSVYLVGLDDYLSDTSRNTHIPALQARGVMVIVEGGSSKPAIGKTKRRMPRAAIKRFGRAEW